MKKTEQCIHSFFLHPFINTEIVISMLLYTTKYLRVFMPDLRAYNTVVNHKILNYDINCFKH